MTDNDVIKALECCQRLKNNNCDNCPLTELQLSECTAKMAKDTLDLINRQKAEIERFQAERQIVKDNCDKALVVLEEAKQSYLKELTKAKTEAIKEFAEELKTRIKNAVFCCYDVRFKNHLQELLRIIVAKVDNLAKDLTEQ